MLEAVGLSKRFGGVSALHDVSLRVASGEFVAVVGPNGSGKTTLINVISGFVKPDAGRVLLNGREVTKWPPHKRARAGLVRTFQLPQLMPGLTVYENALAAASALSGFKRPDEARARELLEAFGLWEVRGLKIHEVSEGHRKLLDVAMAMFLRPKVLLLDEPTSSVSTADKFKVMKVIFDNLKREGVSAVFVEHDMEVVKSFAHRVVKMENGRVVGEETYVKGG
ncbi:MAG: ATP-binding cassette domain-containing protein [Pyrobaculum sp.]